MAKFSSKTYSVNGIDTVVQTAGRGAPLVFFHGAGTFTGFDFAEPWTRTHRVIIPYHPGFGTSADADGFEDVEDYVLHYLDLFEAMDLERFALVGLSMGGWFASRFAAHHADRLDKLVLVCPYGLRDPKHPTTDIMRVRPEDLPATLAYDVGHIVKYLPKGDDPEFAVQRYRESSAFANLVWEQPYDRKLAQWLHRISAPTLIVWGRNDKLIPAGQAKSWAGLIPGAKVKTFDKAGHLVLDESAAAVAAVHDFIGGTDATTKSGKRTRGKGK